MKRLHKTNKGGFTLVELMAVIAIIVILAAISFINVTDAMNHDEEVSDRDSAKFVTQVQSVNDNIRHSMLSGTPAYSS